MTMIEEARIAFFLATSGHSGVDRVMQNLILALVGRCFAVDLLRIRGHGPYLPYTGHGLRQIDLNAGHVQTSLPGLIRYLRHNPPTILLSDKDRVNRTVLVAQQLARSPTRIVVRMGTTVSRNLSTRGPLERWFQRWSMRHLYPRASAVIVPSHGAAQDLASFVNPARCRIRVMPSPVVSASLYQQAREPVVHPWLFNKDRPVIMAVGELCARKDFSTLIRALWRLRQQRDARLIILGRGRQESRLRELAWQLGVADDVDLPGFVPNPYRYLARADVFALTSRCEGMPVALIEALALGVPVVATDCPSGPRELLADGRYGRLVAIGDDAALAQAIAVTLEAPPPGRLISRATHAYAVDYSVKAHLQLMGLTGADTESGYA